MDPIAYRVPGSRGSDIAMNAGGLRRREGGRARAAGGSATVKLSDQPTVFRNRVAAKPSTATPITRSVRYSGQSASSPLPFRKSARTIAM